MGNNKFGKKIEVDKEKYKNVIYANEKSLDMAKPFPEKVSGKIGMIKQMAQMKKKMGRYKKDIDICHKSLEDNVVNCKETTDKEFIKKFKEYAYKIGVGDIGYTKISPELMLQNSVALYPNAIVLTLEMDKEKIDKAPSEETKEMVHNTYDQLNKITNELTEFLRKNGYGAQASLAAGSMVCHYPWIAEKAGLGYRGRHGLVITPKFGPRQRVSVIFTSINNLDFYTGNSHEWIKDFCSKCGKCSRECPGEAILPVSERNEYGNYKHLDSSKCMGSFNKNHGCSICVKVCPFNNVPYEKLKKNSCRMK